MGRIAIHDDERFVRALLGRLTRTHEASEPTPWKVSDAEARDVRGAAQELNARGHHTIADAMLARVASKRE
jgi:transcriptional regulator